MTAEKLEPIIQLCLALAR